jgi:flagellar motor switch protein FliM
VGDTLMLNATPDKPVELRAGFRPADHSPHGRRNHRDRRAS